VSETSGASEVWRVERLARRLAVFVALFFVCVATFLTAIGVDVGGAVVLWCMAIGVMVGIWRWYLVPYVALHADCLEVQGVVSQHSVDYGSISGVRPGSMGLEVQTAREGSILIWAIQKSKVSEWLHKDTRADEVAAAIMERVESASATSAASAIAQPEADTNCTSAPT
jgi:peptidoglycan/LPS O-acetylase OafA/YrhL